MPASSRVRKTPTRNRIPLLLTLLASVPSSALAQSAWTDADVVARVSSHAPSTLAAERAARIARARAEGVGLHPNPSLDWERQESFAPNAQSQDVIRARFPLDLGGRRDAARRLAELEAAQVDADAAVTRRDVAANALVLFYRALAVERHLALLEEGQTVLDEVGRILTVRESQNVASGYERARFSLEAELGRSRLARAGSERDVLLAELAALLGGESRAVDGDFEVEPPASLNALTARAEEAHPALRTLATQRALARSARDATDTAWIPQIAIFGGYNLQIGPQVGHGYAVGVELELPLFDRGQGEQAEANAALDSLGAYGDALQAAVRVEIASARARLEAALAERARFGQATGESAELVLNAARSGYAGGARTLVELLDARRATLAVAERRLALDLAVRLSDVELRRATGEL